MRLKKSTKECLLGVAILVASSGWIIGGIYIYMN
jgi:hypothetical protein